MTKFNFLFVFCAAIGFLKYGGAENSIRCGVESVARSNGVHSSDLPTVSPKIGKLRAKVFRISFPDLPYSVTPGEIAATNTVVNRFYHEVSRGTFQFEFSLHEEIWMAPNASTHYDFSNGAAIFDLVELIDKKNEEVGGFDVSVNSFPRIRQWDGTYIPWSQSTYINGTYDSAVISHELGHFLGLDHANGIDAGSEVFGSVENQSHHVEYGNPFDNMGFTPSFAPFHVQSKWRLGWLDATEVQEIKNSGMYRIYAHDPLNQKGRLVGVRIPIGKTSNGYWVEYRSTNVKTRKGASILFDNYNPDFDGLHLLDMTPGSLSDNVYHDDMSDGTLAPGMVYQDKLASITIKTVAINEGVWDQNAYVDLDITIPGSTAILDPPKILSRNGSELNGPARDVLGRTVYLSDPMSPFWKIQTGKEFFFPLKKEGL